MSYEHSGRWWAHDKCTLLLLYTHDHVLNVKNSEGDKNCPVFRLWSLLVSHFSVHTEHACWHPCYYYSITELKVNAFNTVNANHFSCILKYELTSARHKQWIGQVCWPLLLTRERDCVCVCVRACARACVWERERERERACVRGCCYVFSSLLSAP